MEADITNILRQAKALKRLALLCLFALLALNVMGAEEVADTCDVCSAVEEACQLRDSGRTEEAFARCDTLQRDIMRDFQKQYDQQVLADRSEYSAQEMKLEAEEKFLELVSNICLCMLAAAVFAIILLYFFRQENRTLQNSEREMRDAIQRAEMAEKSKSMFLSNMTHEIRTPLNAIAGFSDVLTYPDLDAETRKETAEIIAMNSNLLQNLIDDVVDTACMDLREMKFRIVACDIVKLSRNVTEMIAKIKKTNAEISFETEEKTLVVMADPLRLQQVLVNVLTNATKFCKQGSIVLRVDNDKEGRKAIISVTDTGIGIPKDKQASVFQRFERVRENAEGFGLGLSICLFIVERFGGKIWVDGEYTDGARFIFTVPYGDPNQKGGSL